MTFSALYVLPALALLLLIQGCGRSTRGKHTSRSRKCQRKARHRVLFFRVLIVALILATALTKVWPLPNLLEIVQGVMITVAIVTPFCVYIVVNTLWPTQPLDSHEPETTRSAPVDTPDLRPAPAHQLAEETRTSRLRVEQRQTDTARHGSQTAEKNATTSLHSQSIEQESALDQTLSVGEQLETLDELVDFHDIGDYEHQFSEMDPVALPAYNPLEKAIAVARDAILDEPGTQDYSTENLPAKNRIELSEMVVRLRSDKMKLQKLVIAQKAVIDSEKQAHERTRVVVKDAISVMRHARHGQRIAEKIARRERAERQRMEKDYVKVRRALDNALSTLKTKSERVDVEEA